MTKRKSFECECSEHRSSLISGSIPTEEREGFFPNSRSYHGLHKRGSIDRLRFWKKGKAKDILTQENLQENDEGTVDDRDDVETVAVSNVAFATPLRVVSPFTKAFQPPQAKEEPDDVRDGAVQLASVRFEELEAPSSLPPRGFWSKLYHHLVADFGAMFLTESFHWICQAGALLWMLLPSSWVIMASKKISGYWRRLWRAFSNQFRLPRCGDPFKGLREGLRWIGQAGAFLWMLLPSSWIIMAWEKISGYWRRLWRAFSNKFRLPPRYRDPFKGFREYLSAGIWKQGGTGTGHYKCAVGATFAGFAYHNQQRYARRRRRAKYTKH